MSSAAELAQTACDALEAAMRRPIFSSRAGYDRAGIYAYLIAIIPFVFMAFASFLAEPPYVPLALDDTSEEAIALEGAKAAFAAGLKTFDDPGDLSKLAAEIGVREAINSGLVANHAKGAIANEKEYAAFLRLCAVGIIFSTLLLATFRAQFRLLNRLWTRICNTPDGPDTEEASHPTARLKSALGPSVSGVIFLTFVATVFFLLVFVDLPGAVEGDGLTPPLIAFIAATTAILVALIWVTAMGSQIIAAFFPDVMKAETLIKAFQRASKQIRHEDPDVPADQARFVDKIYTKLVVTTHYLDGKTVRDRFRTKDYIRDNRPVSDFGLSATQSSAIISGMCVALGVILVLGLVFLWLGIDYMELGISASGAYATALAASTDAWIVFVGVGGSVVLFLTYGLPIMHLRPFVSAEDSAPKAGAKQAKWALKGTVKPSEEDGVTLDLAAPDAGDPKEDPFREIKFLIGANHTKLKTILRAGRHGAGFQELVEDTLTNQLKSILGIIAPALAGGILSIL